MRISDWSSDVCSSDLIAEPLRPLARAVDAITMPWHSPIRELRRNLEARFDLFRRYSINQSRHLFRYEKERTALAAVEAGMGHRDRHERAPEVIDRNQGLGVGRAAGRGRGCHSVVIFGIGLCIQKKNT